MKVLIMSITAGQGHAATADALSRALTDRGVLCTVLDTYKFINPVLSETISKGYLISAFYTPKTSATVYRRAELMEKNDRNLFISKLINTILAKPLKEYIDSLKPDFIVCTHVFAALIANVMKAKGEINVPCAGIITDFTIHPFWQDVVNFEKIVIASELLAYQAIKKGIEQDKLMPVGIPIDSKFSAKNNKREASIQLGIDPDKKTILLMGGSMGFGNITNNIRRLDVPDIDYQVLVVCGNNKKTYNRAVNMKTKKDFHIFGYVNNIDVMMDASDLIVTKPGGLTISEALSKKLPIIMVNPIPGQEDRNCEFLLNNGLGMLSTDTFPLDEAIYQLFTHSTRMDDMKNNICAIGKTHATDDLCDYICSVGGSNE